MSATILPAQSEIVLSALLYAGKQSALLLVIVATIGNVLGSVVNYFLGMYLIYFKDKKWFPINEKMLKKATDFYQKYGVWSLLLA